MFYGFFNNQEVLGVRESDYFSEDNNWKHFCRGGGYVKDLPTDINEHEQFGAVQWVFF